MREWKDHYTISGEAYISAIGAKAMRGLISEDFPLHSHDYYETFIIVSGNATHIQGEFVYPLNRGDVFAIKGNAAHGFRDVKGLDIINLMYSPGFFDQQYSEVRAIPGFDDFFLVEPEIRLQTDYTPVLKLNDSEMKYVMMMTDFICEQQERQLASLFPLLRMNFRALVSYLATLYETQRSTQPQEYALSRILAYMEQHIAEPIQLENISSSVYISSRQLQRLFKRYFCVSPMKYLQRMRLKRALTLLINQDISITDAAAQSGFDDVSYFTRIFHLTYGITPNAARQHIRGISLRTS